MLGIDTFVAADIVYNKDKAKVERVQRALAALGEAKPAKDSSFKNLAEALRKGGYGEYGPATKKAVAAFNKLYGWADDGADITNGTLEALTRPDLQPGYAAKIAALDAAAKQQAVQAEALAKQGAAAPPAAVAAVKAQAQATAASVAAQAATKGDKATAQAAQARLNAATTPAEVKAAIEDVQKAAAELGEEESWLTQKTITSIAPNYAVVLGGAVIAWILWRFFGRRFVALLPSRAPALAAPRAALPANVIDSTAVRS